MCCGVFRSIMEKPKQKLTQVTVNFFLKTSQMILQARSLDEHGKGKLNKWFNLHTFNSDDLRLELRLWRSTIDLTAVPPMIVETYLDLGNLPQGHTLALKDEHGNLWPVTKGGSKKTEVVLERWLVEFDPNEFGTIEELPYIYKQAIILCRSIYTIIRIMPAALLRNQLPHYVLANKIVDGSKPISLKGRIGLSKTIIPHQMLTDTHVRHRTFLPIETLLGTLKVSVAYRSHCEFTELAEWDHRELGREKEPREDLRQVESKGEEDHSIESIPYEEKAYKTDEEKSDKTPEHVQYKPFKPEFKQLEAVKLEGSDFKSELHEGTSPLSLSGSPSSPPRDDKKRPSIQPFRVGSIGNLPPPASSSLERRISITSNKSTSNASLAAVLRNPRSSFSIPIAGSIGTGAPVTGGFPRSVSLSHGYGYEDSDSAANTPRFLSSFGSRASRRFSNTSVRHGSLHDTTSPLGTSAGLATLIPLSGLYIDDDISDFVRMIDSKQDLRFGHDSGGLGSQLGSQYEVLNRFHQLKSQHQQLGDSVNASVMMHRKSSSPPGSYESHVPSIHSRLRESSEPHPAPATAPAPGPLIKPASKMMSSPVISTTSAHAMSQTASATTRDEIVGLATTPSTYRKHLHYENVFDDDDEDEDHHGYFKAKARSKSLSRSHFDDDDDLLFTMSDTNLAKH